MTYNRIFNISNSASVTVTHSGAPEFTSCFSVVQSLGFYVVVFSALLFVLFSFPLAIVLSVLRNTDSDYPFGIFKHFLIRYMPKLVGFWSRKWPFSFSKTYH